MRPSTCAPLWRSTITASIPAFARSWPSSRPAGPAPTIATCVARLRPATASAWSRRLHALAALRVRRRRRRHEREQRAGVVRLPRARADRGREGGDDLDRRWQRPEHVDARDVEQLRELLKAEATSPRATSAPTGTPGGGVTIRSRIRSAMPQRWNSFASATPLGPVESPIVRRRLHRAPERRPRCRSPAAARRPAPRPRRWSARGRPCCRRRGARRRAACRWRRTRAPRRRTARRPARAGRRRRRRRIRSRSRAANEPRTRSRGRRAWPSSPSTRCR